MKLQKLELVNFCQYDDRTVEFSPHFNLIAGPNGSGKSNMIRAMLYALTGDAGGTGTKADDIRQGAPEGSRAYVRLTLEHRGDTIEVYRGLRPNKVLLTVNGERYGRTIVEVNEEIERRLGISRRYLQEHIFVRQQQITAWLELRPADRAKELARLFGTDTAERIWQAIMTATSRVEIPPYPDDIEQVRSTLAEMFAKRDKYEAELSRLEAVRLSPETVAEYRRQIAARDRQQQLYAEAQRRIDAVLPKTERFGELAVALAEAVAEHDEAKRAFDQLLAEYGDVEERLSELNAAAQLYTERANEVASLEQAVITLASTISEPTTEIVDYSPDRVRELYGEFASLTSQLEHARARLAKLQQVDEANCPTCGQPVDKQTLSASLQQEIAQLEAAAADVKARYEQYHDYEQRLKSYNESLQRLRRLQERLDEAVAKLGDPPDEEELNKLRRGREQLQRAGLRVSETLVAQTKVKTEYESTRANIKDEEEMASRKLAEAYAIEVSDDVEAMESQLRDQSEIEANIRVLTDSLTDLRRQLGVMEGVLQRADAQIAKRERVKAALEHMTKLRRIFHRDELQRVVTYTYMERLLGDINETLEIFDAPFRVEPTEDLGFTALFADGRRIPDRRLSVGQRVVLAFALRIALNTLFIGSDVLVLDEAQAYLDEQHLARLPDALKQLRKLASTNGLQLLFVTHDPRLSYLFDNVVYSEV